MKASIRVAAAMMSAVFVTQACADQMPGKTISDEELEREITDPLQLSLARSACKGDLKGVREAIRSGAHPNTGGTRGVTPLIWAVHCGNRTGVEALLDAGGDPNQSMQGRGNAVYAALTHGNTDILKLLLARGGDPNASDDGGFLLEEAFLAGVERGYWAHYEAILNAGIDVNRDEGPAEEVVITAAALGYFDKVEGLLDRGYRRDLSDLADMVAAKEVEGALADDKKRLLARLKRLGAEPSVPFETGR